MKKTTPDKNKKNYSKGFTEGINSLYEEIQLAHQWHRPSILLAIHNTPAGQAIAQQFLEKKLVAEKLVIRHITPELNTPDVINTVCTIPNREKTVFFISKLENINQLSDGLVYRALNMHREHLVEQKICAVFWLTETEAAKLPRLAPDLWAFRHRVVEFAPQRGSRNPSTPSRLFLWKEQLPSLSNQEYEKQLAYYEDVLSQLPNEESAITTRFDTTLKLLHINWHLNHPQQFSNHINNLYALLKTHSNLQYQRWALNTNGIKIFEEGDKKNARISFEEALKAEPNNSIFIINSAIVAHGLGKNRDAILLAKRAIKNEPANSCLWHILGFLYLFMGNTQNAVEAIETALEKEPNHIEIKYTLAICYAKNNQPEACTLQLEKINKAHSQQNALQTAYLSILLGNTENALTNLHQALKTKEINEHQLLQNPNLHALLDMQSLMNIIQ